LENIFDTIVPDIVLTIIPGRKGVKEANRQKIGQTVSQNGSQVHLPVVVFEVVERGTDRGK
jgi:hypothetical protein